MLILYKISFIKQTFMKDYKFKIWKKSYKVKNEYELSLIFSLIYDNDDLGDDIAWSVIMQLDTDLLEIIKTYRGLIACLKRLSSKNQLLFLLKVGDNLSNIIKSSEHLSQILARIPDDFNKLTLLKRLRLKWLSNFIRDARDLWNILEFIYWDAQREFLEILGVSFIKQVFLRTNEIIIILYFLENKNKDLLIDMIWLEWIYRKVKTYKDLLLMFWWLSEEKSKEFMALYKKEELLDFFLNDEEFHYFLLRLTPNKEKIFLEKLK